MYTAARSSSEIKKKPGKQWEKRYKTFSTEKEWVHEDVYEGTGKYISGESRSVSQEYQAIVTIVYILTWSFWDSLSQAANIRPLYAWLCIFLVIICGFISIFLTAGISESKYFKKYFKSTTLYLIFFYLSAILFSFTKSETTFEELIKYRSEFVIDNRIEDYNEKKNDLSYIGCLYSEHGSNEFFKIKFENGKVFIQLKGDEKTYKDKGEYTVSGNKVVISSLKSFSKNYDSDEYEESEKKGNFNLNGSYTFKVLDDTYGYRRFILDKDELLRGCPTRFNLYSSEFFDF